MRYCRICVLPDTRPNSTFDATGTCDLATPERKDAVDWALRAREFRALADAASARNAAHDCVVPVSGGKDSTYQVVRCLEHGLRPLAVTWRSPGRSELGTRNLENLVQLGVDHVDYRVNPRVERAFTLKALEQKGIPALPMHMALFSIPTRLAAALGIPLVVWGENSAFEYGGSDEALRGARLDGAWLARYGNTAGTTAADWVGDGLTEKDSASYVFPSDADLERAGTRAVFLGYYFRWDSAANLEVALRHGFTRRLEGPRTGTLDYADIDDDFISVHHWLKWHKFGFTRSYDTLSREIHAGRLTRTEAIERLRARGDETPHEDIERFCGFVGITTRRFHEIADGFRDPRVWTRKGGRWVIEGFLIPGWEWA